MKSLQGFISRYEHVAAGKCTPHVGIQKPDLLLQILHIDSRVRPQIVTESTGALQRFVNLIICVSRSTMFVLRNFYSTSFPSELVMFLIPLAVWSHKTNW